MAVQFRHGRMTSKNTFCYDALILIAAHMHAFAGTPIEEVYRVLAKATLPLVPEARSLVALLKD